jgi:hypothetical protein
VIVWFFHCKGGEKMEDVKIKLAVLWLIKDLAFVGSGLLVLYEPGGIQDMISGYMYGSMQLGDATSLLLTSLSLVFLIMAILSLNLKNSLNRWANIIVAIVMMIISIISTISLGTLTITHYLNEAFQFVILILIVWFAWTWKED